MQNISIQRYAPDAGHGFSGCIEPEDRSWILFLRDDGEPVFFAKRDAETGAVLTEEVAS